MGPEGALCGTRHNRESNTKFGRCRPKEKAALEKGEKVEWAEQPGRIGLGEERGEGAGRSRPESGREAAGGS